MSVYSVTKDTFNNDKLGEDNFLLSTNQTNRSNKEKAHGNLKLKKLKTEGQITFN